MPKKPTYMDLKSSKFIEPIVYFVEELLSVKFKPAGKNRYSAYCPFHPDTKPSFSMYVDGKDAVKFHCFGACSGNWDIYDLIQLRKKCGLKDAQTILADHLGIKDFDPYAGGSQRYDEEPAQEPDENAEVREPVKIDGDVIGAMEETAQFYHDLLKIQLEELLKVHQFLLRRGLTGAVINDFNVGYAPPLPDEKYEGRALLSQHLDRFKKDYREFNKFRNGGLFRLLNDETHKGHLYYRRFIDFDRDRWGAYGSYADYFAGRITFPIYGIDGRIQGFMGRRPDNRGSNRMKATTERTQVRPRTWLYGIDKAARSIQYYRTIILVEGIFDYFAFYNILQDTSRPIVVSTLGTILTDDARALLNDLGVENIVVAYDWDDAGQKAILKFRAPGKTIHYLGGMKEGQDPAEDLKEALNTISGFSIRHLSEAARKAQEHTDKPVMVSHLGMGRAEKREVLFKPRDAMRTEPVPELPSMKAQPKECHYDADEFLPLLAYDHGNKASLDAKLKQIIEMLESRATNTKAEKTFSLPINFLLDALYLDMGPALILWLRLAIEQQIRERRIKTTDGEIAGWLNTSRPQVIKYKGMLREQGFLNVSIDKSKKVQSMSVKYFPDR